MRLRRHMGGMWCAGSRSEGGDAFEEANGEEYRVRKVGVRAGERLRSDIGGIWCAGSRSEGAVCACER